MDCIGSGVQGDWLEFGHTIVPGTERQMFLYRHNGSENLDSHYPTSRCRYCASTRYHWRRQDMRPKAAQAFRREAKSVVRHELASDVKQAKLLMVATGVTPEFIAEMFRGAIGQECPGLCGFPERHIIEKLHDLQFDWRDPRYLLTHENCGPLCATCNQQKGDMPWAEFIARQQMIRLNLERMVPFSSPRLFEFGVAGGMIGWCDDRRPHR